MSSILGAANASLRNLHISFFPRVCRNAILCRLVFLIFVGDLWRDKRDHLVLASLRNGDFEKLCKIQVGILTCCLGAPLSVQRLFDDHHLVRYVFCRLFLTSIQGIRNQFEDHWPILHLLSTAYGFHLEPSSQNGQKETTTKPFVMILDPEHRTGHFQIVHLLRLQCGIWTCSFLFLAEAGSFVWQQVPLWTWRTRFP